MGEKTAIEWADHTTNFFLGCTKVSKGCDNCYMFRNLAYTKFDPSVVTQTIWENRIKDLKKWSASIIFTNSMSDSFHESISMEKIRSMFDIMDSFQKHKFIILTKRINKAYNYFKLNPIPANCWIGTSIENRSQLHRLGKLKMIKAKTKFVSFEPLLERLGEIRLADISWVIVGGESDFRHPRPFRVSWAREIRDQCHRLSIPFFYKQSGGKKKINGCWGSNEIDGKKYLEMPELLTTKQSVQVEKF
jgi:protein gp37